MSATVVCGMQWGDEGKGKIIDFLADKAKVVVRYQGGNNAGHTVIVNDQKYVLHLLPSGVLNHHTTCILAPGVLVDPKVLLEELSELETRGLTTHHVFISDRCHLILPYHILLDTLKEDSLGENKIGTTKRGIGPAYMDKYERIGIRAIDLLNIDSLIEKIKQNTKDKNDIITKIYGKEPLDVEQIIDNFVQYAQLLKTRIIDSTTILNDHLEKQHHVLFEGAQALMLDVDHGSYPFVTSSSPTVGAVCVGAGISPHWLTQRIGVFKAYSTRVGAGPFPSELFDEKAETIRLLGNEFGSTTKRPRRCGWLDLIALRYAMRINGFTELAMMKADILNNFSEILVCIGYSINGEHCTSIPADMSQEITPIYKSFPGWQCDTQHIKSYEELPTALKNYINFIEEFLGTSITTISLGPKRHETIRR